MFDFSNVAILGSWVLDVILILISASACFYCALLSRRLKALNALDVGVGASIVSLTDAIGKTHDAAREAQSSTHQTVETLRSLLEKCESMGPNIESAIAELDIGLETARKLKLQIKDEITPELLDATEGARTTAKSLLKMLQVVEKRLQPANDKVPGSVNLSADSKNKQQELNKVALNKAALNKVEEVKASRLKLNSGSMTSASSAAHLTFSGAAGHDFNVKVAP